MPVILHHAPPSFYSQIARLVLAEKGVPHQAKLAAAGPPLFETYAPWYMRLNPNGTVPTLVDGETAVPDSRAILAYVDANFDGPSLTPSDPDERAAMDDTIAAVYDVSVRDVTYGSGRTAKIGARVNGKRIARLRKLAARHPDMRDVYQAKLRDIEGFAAACADQDGVEQQQRRMLALLDRFEQRLADRPFVAGSSYSLADVVATVTVARLAMLGKDPLARRPALAGWFERMRARPSFVSADIWDRFVPAKLVKMIARKLGPYLLAGLAALLLLGWVIWYLVARL